MSLTDKEQIKVCKIWLRTNLHTIYPDGYDKGDIDNLMEAVGGGNDIHRINVNIPNIETYVRKLEAHIFNKKSVSYIKAIILILITAFVTNIDRIIKGLIFLFKKWSGE